MKGISGIIDKALSRPRALSADELEALLASDDEGDRRAVREAAYALKLAKCGRGVSLRGLIEMSNVCAKNCYYCGIRSGNRDVRRFKLSYEDIMRHAGIVMRSGYASLVLQGGEVESRENTEFVAKVLRGIQELSGGSIGVTLSLGEQTEEVYAEWRAAGARRYLLRIEESDPEMYRKLHPETGHSYERRKECLRALRRTGYQVGTGVMIGLPGQTFRHLASDIIFFGDMDADMIGMGPFIPHYAAPVGKGICLTPEYAGRQLELGLRMISAVRLYLHDVNIASTTALQALAPDGRERGVLAGANVIMPNVTDTERRRDYLLYENKPGIDENADSSRKALEDSIHAIGEDLLYGRFGDSPHYAARTAAAAERNG